VAFGTTTQDLGSAHTACRIAQRKAECILDGVYHRKKATAMERAGHVSAVVETDLPDAEAPAVIMTVAGPPGQSAVDDAVGVELPEWMQHSDGRMSPPPVVLNSVTRDEILDEDDDRDLLLQMRRQVGANAART
jgi:hypothetical protein